MDKEQWQRLFIFFLYMNTCFHLSPNWLRQVLALNVVDSAFVYNPACRLKPCPFILPTSIPVNHQSDSFMDEEARSTCHSCTSTYFSKGIAPSCSEKNHRRRRRRKRLPGVVNNGRSWHLEPDGMRRGGWWLTMGLCHGAVQHTATVLVGLLECDSSPNHLPSPISKCFHGSFQMERYMR